jgi:phosphatidylethanolamine N-methyltransferase
MDSIMHLKAFIDFSESNFKNALLYTLINFLLWIIIPHLEFRYKLLSKLFGGKMTIASDFLSYVLIYLGAIRNHYFSKAIRKNVQVDFGYIEIPIIGASYIFMLIGLILVFFSFYRLGLRGMYFGDHFGFLFQQRITEFPYDYFENPQYVGTTTFFIALSIRHGSPAGVLITILLYLFYRILNEVERRKLDIFYPNNKSEKEVEKEISNPKKIN